jgi:hypothetical protein
MSIMALAEASRFTNQDVILERVATLTLTAACGAFLVYNKYMPRRIKRV